MEEYFVKKMGQYFFGGLAFGLVWCAYVIMLAFGMNVSVLDKLDQRSRKGLEWRKWECFKDFGWDSWVEGQENETPQGELQEDARWVSEGKSSGQRVDKIDVSNVEQEVRELNEAIHALKARAKLKEGYEKVSLLYY